MNFKNFAFDVDGCLVNKKMELIEGASELISTIMTKIPDAKFCIASGASLFEVELAIDLVNQKLPQNQKFLPNIIAHGGGFVKNQNGLIESPFLPEEVAEMVQIIRAIDPQTAVCYRTKDVNFFADQNLPEDIISILKTLPKSFGILQNLKSKEYADKRIANSEIFGLEIVSRHNKKIFEAFKKRFEPEGFIVSEGTCIEINKVGKVKALENVFGDLKKVVYFGDGFNDIPCFKVCGLSFGIGNKTEVVKNATYQIKTHFEPIEKLF